VRIDPTSTSTDRDEQLSTVRRALCIRIVGPTLGGIRFVSDSKTMNSGVLKERVSRSLWSRCLTSYHWVASRYLDQVMI